MDAQAARSQLFTVKLEDFVAERDRLAGELKTAGDKTGAAALKKLPRPTVNVWALNQVARQEAKLVAEVFAAGDEQSGDVRSRTVRFRAAITKVVGAAARVLVESARPASPAVLRKIERALEAAPFADADDQAALRAGELSRDLAPDDDDDPLAAMLGASLAGATPAAEKTPTARAPAGEDGKSAAERDKELKALELRRLRDAVTAAEARRRTAASDASLAEERARSAVVDVQRAQKALLAAEQRQAETQQALAEADAELEAARARLGEKT